MTGGDDMPSSDDLEAALLDVARRHPAMKTVNITGDNRAESLAELRAGIGKEIIVRYPDGHTESGVLRVVTDDYIEFDPPPELVEQRLRSALVALRDMAEAATERYGDIDPQIWAFDVVDIVDAALGEAGTHRPVEGTES